MQKEMMAALAVLLCVSPAVPAVGQDLQLIGYTTVSRNGAGGVLLFHDDCLDQFEATFGPGVRACTSADLINGGLPATGKPIDPNTSATNWVLPSFVVSSGSSVVDTSGKVGTVAKLSCDGWSSSAASVTGLTVNDNGRFILAACSGARNIACCAPVP